ncbi:MULTISPECIES: hypothetical protein [unclassified Streptomyces]|uniref:hypothetical protein n=1 Tax=unclassified Streptomyces TaxID=2593676 RepID=UPI003803A4C8
MDDDASLDRILQAAVKDSGDEVQRCRNCNAELVITVKEAVREPGKGLPEVQVKAHCPTGCKAPLYRSH